MSLEERKRQFEIFAEETGDRCRTVMSCSDENLDTVLPGSTPGHRADWIIVHAPPLCFRPALMGLQEYYDHIADNRHQRGGTTDYN